MKAITVKQPWAHLICSGIKDVENRTWKTNFRGRVLIHTSAKPNTYPLDMVFTKMQLDELLKHNTENYWCGHKCFGAKYYDSAIIGSVEIVDCVQNHPSIWAEKGETNCSEKCLKIDCEHFIECGFMSNNDCRSCKLIGQSYEIEEVPKECPNKMKINKMYHWVIANPVMFKNPIENVKGKLSFWESDIEVCHPDIIRTCENRF